MILLLEPRIGCVWNIGSLGDNRIARAVQVQRGNPGALGPCGGVIRKTADVRVVGNPRSTRRILQIRVPKATTSGVSRQIHLRRSGGRQHLLNVRVQQQIAIGAAVQRVPVIGEQSVTTVAVGRKALKVQAPGVSRCQKTVRHHHRAQRCVARLLGERRRADVLRGVFRYGSVRAVGGVR